MKNNDLTENIKEVNIKTGSGPSCGGYFIDFTINVFNQINDSDYTQCSGKIEDDFTTYTPEWLSIKFNTSSSHECAKFRLPVCSEPDHFLKVHFLINLYSSHC